MFGITKFHQYLRGRHFEAVTDHKQLLELLGVNETEHLRELRSHCRAMSYSEPGLKVSYVSGCGESWE